MHGLLILLLQFIICVIQLGEHWLENTLLSVKACTLSHVYPGKDLIFILHRIIFVITYTLFYLGMAPSFF
jgi:hypothetical protein